MQSVQKENRAVNSGLEVEGEERVVAQIVSHIRCFWTLCTYIYIYFYLSYFKNTKDEYKLKLFVEKKTDGNSYTLCSTQFSFICIVPFYNNIPHKVLYSVK